MKICGTQTTATMAMAPEGVAAQDPDLDPRRPVATPATLPATAGNKISPRLPNGPSQAHSGGCRRCTDTPSPRRCTGTLLSLPPCMGVAAFPSSSATTQQQHTTTPSFRPGQLAAGFHDRADQMAGGDGEIGRRQGSGEGDERCC